MRTFDIGDRVADKESMRMGTVVDLVEERNEQGDITYLGAKIDFGNGIVDWVSGDSVTKLLLESGEMSQEYFLLINRVKEPQKEVRMPNDERKKKKVWVEPEDKTQWLLDLIDAGEAVVVGYEKYLMNRLDYNQLAKLMLQMRELLPMSIEDKLDKDS